MPTKISMMLKTSWKMTPTLKRKNLKLCSEITSKENESAYVGTNYKDEPTLNGETKKQPKSSLNNFRNQKILTPTTNGCN
jgi:hypothetical protein